MLKRLLVLVAALGVGLLLAHDPVAVGRPAPAAAAYLLTVDPAAPHVWDTVTFSGTFPSSAFQQSRNPQYPFNPQLSILCSLADGSRWAQVTTFNKGKKNPDGTFNAVSPPVPLTDGNYQGQGVSWPAGVSGSCNANAYSASAAKDGSTVFTPYGSVQFDVA